MTSSSSTPDPSRNDPLARLPAVPTFSLTSPDFPDGGPLAPAQRSGVMGVPGGQDRSPELSWSGAPAGTASFALTAYDPDARTGAGLWHWAVVDIPAATTQLAAGAGESDADLPAGAFHLPNDLRLHRYAGAAPPPGDGPHRYFFVLSALSVATVGIAPDSTPSFLGFAMRPHVVARAVLVGTGESPGDGR